MNRLSPGTLCIVIRTHSGTEVGRLVKVVYYSGPTVYGPQCYLVRCVAGRSFKVWRRMDDGREVTGQGYAAIVDRSQLKPIPGLDLTAERLLQFELEHAEARDLIEMMRSR